MITLIKEKEELKEKLKSKNPEQEQPSSQVELQKKERHLKIANQDKLHYNQEWNKLQKELEKALCENRRLWNLWNLSNEEKETFRVQIQRAGSQAAQEHNQISLEKEQLRKELNDEKLKNKQFADLLNRAKWDNVEVTELLNRSTQEKDKLDLQLKSAIRRN